MTKNEILKRLSVINYVVGEIIEELDEIKQEINEMYFEIEKNLNEENIPVLETDYEV